MNKKKIYNNYISVLFKNFHNIKKIDKEFKYYYLYFKKNYSRYIPKNREINILDLGCGMGHFLYFLEKEGYKKYLGVDTSNEEINFCKKKGFNVINSDIFDFLKNKNELYDLIVFNDVIEHLTKEEIFKILDLIKMALKNKGQLIIKTPNMANFMAVSSRYIDITHEVGFCEESLKEVCLMANFKFVKILGLDIYVFYLNPLNYLAKFSVFILNKFFHLLFLLYGRKTTHIFTKNIMAVCQK